MKDEIKEILDRLERIDHKEYIAFEFADSATFDETARCFEERKKMADYITNLQEEVNKLTAESTEWEERTYCWQDRAENLQINIDKAIEYITNNDELYYGDELYDSYQIIINILQGSDNNSNN